MNAKERHGTCGCKGTFVKTDCPTIHTVVDCECWACPKCTKEILKPKHIEHCFKIARRLGFLYYCKYSGCHIEKVRDDIYEGILRGANYLRYLYPDGTMHVFSVEPIGKRLEGEKACKVLEEVILNIPLGKRPWSASTKWMIHHKKIKQGYTKIATSRVSLEALEAVAATNGFKASIHRGVLSIRCNERDALKMLATVRQWGLPRNPKRQTTGDDDKKAAVLSSMKPSFATKDFAEPIAWKPPTKPANVWPIYHEMEYPPRI